MSDGLFADPDGMERAVDLAAEAADGLVQGTDLLEFARGSIERSTGPGHGGPSMLPNPLGHKTETMVVQWTEEFNKIAELLVAYEEVVRLAARAYRTGDGELAEALEDFAAGELPDDGEC